MQKRKLRLLLIDDDEVNNFILLRRIKETGIPVSCSSVNNGKKGIKKLQTWDQRNDPQYPDIILLDLDMPVMDGFAFLDLYQESLYHKHPDVSLYMVSSSIRVEDRLKAKSYQAVSTFISKPISFPVIEEIINQSLRKTMNLRM